MLRDQIIATLRPAIPELARDFGVRSLSLFGSVARGDDSASSDVDLLVEFDPAATVTLFTMAALRTRVASLLGREVDLVEDHPGLRASFRASLMRDRCRVA